VLNALNSWSMLRWLSEDSYFYSLLFNNVWEWRRGLNWQRSNATAVEYAGATRIDDSTLLAYQQELAEQLLIRMCETCAKAGVKLIVVDIPSWKAIDDFESSLPPAVLKAAQDHQLAVLTSDIVLERYRHVAELFVAHGQHHISETTHLQIALSL